MYLTHRNSGREERWTVKRKTGGQRTSLMYVPIRTTVYRTGLLLAFRRATGELLALHLACAPRDAVKRMWDF